MGEIATGTGLACADIVYLLILGMVAYRAWMDPPSLYARNTCTQTSVTIIVKMARRSGGAIICSPDESGRCVCAGLYAHHAM